MIPSVVQVRIINYFEVLACFVIAFDSIFSTPVSKKSNADFSDGIEEVEEVDSGDESDS
jgi:hypothetical protein